MPKAHSTLWTRKNHMNTLCLCHRITISTVKDRFANDLLRVAHPRGMDREFVVELIGIEPTTSGLQSPRSPS